MIIDERMRIKEEMIEISRGKEYVKRSLNYFKRGRIKKLSINTIGFISYL